MKYFAHSLILKARLLEIRKWSTYRYSLRFIDIAMNLEQNLTRSFVLILSLNYYVISGHYFTSYIFL